MLLRINLILLAAFALSMISVALVVTSLLQENALREVLAQAGLMMDSAAAMRSYTEDEVRPLLEGRMDQVFLPQSIPFYAATQHFLKLQQEHPDYSYKEAALNPTNPRDRATDWQADIVQRFRDDAGMKQLTGTRDTALGRNLYMARPIRAEAGCLGCHGLASAAPATLLGRYGSDNGFGWQANEVIGAQIVSVPFAAAEASARHVRDRVLVAIGAMFVGVLLVVNASLYVLVIRPIRRIANHADRVSLGDSSPPHLPTGGGREVAALSAAFNRMRKSLDKALRMLGD